MGFKTYTCPIAKECGGCEWLAVPYPIQLRRKQEWVERLFEQVINEVLLRQAEGNDAYAELAQLRVSQSAAYLLLSPVPGISVQDCLYTVPFLAYKKKMLRGQHLSKGYTPRDRVQLIR